MILAGCSFDSNELKGYPEIDSSPAIDGPSHGVDGQNEILDGNGDDGTKDAVRGFDIWSDADRDAPADGAMDSPSDSPVPTAIDGVIDIPKDATSDAASDLRDDSVAVSDGRNDACMPTTFKATAILSDILLVLDRSGSMDYSTTDDSNCRSGSSSCTARWPALTSAVDATLTSTAGSINWGLKLFSSSGNACGVNSGVEVAISATSVPDIQDRVGNTAPGGNTPTAQAITAATAYLTNVKDQNAKYILLATDGEPNCTSTGNSDPNVQPTVDALAAAKNAGFVVYVIGIGPSVGNLDSFAAAGGTNKYFPASSPQDLATAFATISKAVTTCTFVLSQTPSDPNNLAVYFNKNLVPKDGSNGWIFGSTSSQIVFTGTLCESVKANPTVTVEALGCAA